MQWPLTPDSASAAPSVPHFSHVIVVFVENESATNTFEAGAANAPYFTQLRNSNAYIPGYYGVGHASLDNYLAVFSGQQPTLLTTHDCEGVPWGQCVYPSSIPTIATLLDAAGLSWRVYSEGMEGVPAIGGPCLHPASRDAPDSFDGVDTNGYVLHHNPAVYFDSVLADGGSEAYCDEHNVDLSHLYQDLQSPAALPAFSFVEPDFCHDGVPAGTCPSPPEGPNYPSGVPGIEKFLQGFVRTVTTSPGWDSRSALFVTFDEATPTDTSGCASCGDSSAGGRVGAVVVSPLAKASFTSSWQGDHYGLLRTVEAGFGLSTLSQTAPSAQDGDRGVQPVSGVWAAGPGGAVPDLPPGVPTLGLLLVLGVGFLVRKNLRRSDA